jgi:hypothetical protein
MVQEFFDFIIKQDMHILLPCLVGGIVILNVVARIVMMTVKLGVMAAVVFVMVQLGPDIFLPV